MKRYLVIPILLLTSFTTGADNSSTMQPPGANQYQECVAVSLHTMNGKELNSMVRNNRTIEVANSIPEGWSVVGVTAKRDGAISRPYLVICH